MPMESIAVKNLYKKYKISQRQEGFAGMVKYLFHPQYKEKEAVKGISFSIQQGECVAFLGANGAGKSTTIKMLTGIMKPTEGKISVMGNDPFRERLINAGKIGVVFGQKTQLWWDIPVKDSFELLHSIYEIPDNVYEENLDLFKKILELEEFMDQPARKLSLGQRVRADIAAALLKIALGDEEKQEIVEEPSRSRKEGRSKSKDTGASEGMIRLFINVGRNQRVQAKDILGAIAGEVGIPGKLVGTIDIYDKYTFVEVPKENAKKVLDKMKDIKIKGNKINIERANRKRK